MNERMRDIDKLRDIAQRAGFADTSEKDIDITNVGTEAYEQKQQLQEIIRRAGIVDVPMETVDLEKMVREVHTEKRWLKQILGAPSFSTSGGTYQSVNSLSVGYLESCNSKIEEALSDGYNLFYTDGYIYQVLEPNSQRLIRFWSDEFHTQRDFPQDLPVISGQLRASIEAVEGFNTAYFNVTCGKLPLARQFSRKDASQSPALYAVSSRPDLSPITILFFGQFDKDRFIRLKKAA